jgi:3-oxoacyl-[acyl-carrier-protein] synthase II
VTDGVSERESERMSPPAGARVGARLFVTGLGLVTPLGPNAEATWSRLVRGDRAIRPITLFDPAGQRASFAAEVGDVDLPAGPRDVTAAWSRTSAMAMSAAGEAMRMAGLRPGGSGTRRVGLVVGGTTGGMFETERLLARLHAEPSSREVLAGMLSHPLTATGDRLDERLGPFCRVRTLSSACSSGANALVVAAGWLLSGEVDAVVAGGSDGLCRLTLTGFNAIAAIDPEPCRPFDRRRRGTTLGEGAGFLVLEREESARARGASPVVELAGWALGSESHHITNPDPDGAVVAALIEQALERSGLSAADVDYVNAHGTGTLANDRMEAVALARALGPEIGRVPVSSSKGQIGHTLGAAGAIEAAITALVVSRRTVVPTGGLDEPDPALGLLHVLGSGREVPRVRAALSNAFGFGGMDTVLVFAEPARDGRGAATASSCATGSAQEAQRSSTGARVVVTGAAVFGPCGRLGPDECATLPESRFDAGASVDADSFLDAARARRLDRAACLGAVAVEHALNESKAPRDGVGIVLGSSFGSVDGCAAFMHRIFSKGPRSASPAEFPNLVPSAAVGHVSIYGGLHGPAFGTADLATSGESAIVQAWQLVAGREAVRVVGGSAEPRGDIAERVLSGLFDGIDAPMRSVTARADVAAAVLLEDEEEARARGGRILARVECVHEWRGDRAPSLAELRAPRDPRRAEVVQARVTPSGEQLASETAWRACPRVACAPALGESDALGAVAVVVAASRIASGRIVEALVLGVAQGRGYALVLSAV